MRRRLVALALCLAMSACGGHPSYALMLDNETPSDMVRDQRNDYKAVGFSIVPMGDEMWVRIIYAPAPHVTDRALVVCGQPMSWFGKPYKLFRCISVPQGM